MRIFKCNIFILLLLLAGGIVFAQADTHRHEPFDMLLGFNVGAGAGWTPGFFDAFKEGDPTAIKAGNINAAVSVGLNYDLYLFPWLSLSTGLSLRPMAALVLKEDATNFNIDDLSEWEDIVIVRNPISLTFPVQVHVNIPRVEWLYLGAGVSINIPVEKIDISSVIDDGGLAERGRTFISIPVDLGFDFIKPGRGGSRLFFRYEPSFLESDVMVNTFGFVWQIYNFKLNHRK
jgi:hypothetical protein